MSTLAESPAVDPRIKSIAGEVRRQLSGIYGDRLVRLVLFGSQARGDARPWSDIDVMLVLRGPVNTEQEAKRTIDAIARLSLNHDCVIMPEFVDQAEFTRGHSSLVDTVLEEGLEID